MAAIVATRTPRVVPRTSAAPAAGFSATRAAGRRDAVGHGVTDPRARALTTQPLQPRPQAGAAPVRPGRRRRARGTHLHARAVCVVAASPTSTAEALRQRARRPSAGRDRGHAHPGRPPGERDARPLGPATCLRGSPLPPPARSVLRGRGRFWRRAGRPGRRRACRGREAATGGMLSAARASASGHTADHGLAHDESARQPGLVTRDRVPPGERPCPAALSQPTARRN